MQIYEYVSNEWVDVWQEWDQKYVPNSSTVTSSGTISTITGTDGNNYGGVFFGVKPNTQYKITLLGNVMSTLINPTTITEAQSYFWIAATNNGSYPNARTVSSSSISKEFVNNRTEIIITTAADEDGIVFCFCDTQGTSTNRADTYFYGIYNTAQEFYTGWTPRELNMSERGWGLYGAVYVSYDNEWYY